MNRLSMIVPSLLMATLSSLTVHSQTLEERGLHAQRAETSTVSVANQANQYFERLIAIFLSFAILFFNDLT